jgi:hypothetical protein
MPVDTDKSKEAEGTLPPELRAAYRRMVEEYEFLTHVRYGRGYVAYGVLAQMVLAGWRPNAEPHASSLLASKRGGNSS